MKDLLISLVVWRGLCQALEKMEVVEEVVEEQRFRFHLPSPEPLGRPILSIQRVRSWGRRGDMGVMGVMMCARLLDQSPASNNPLRNVSPCSFPTGLVRVSRAG
jgi:hypothetical protein